MQCVEFFHRAQENLVNNTTVKSTRNEGSSRICRSIVIVRIDAIVLLICVILILCKWSYDAFASNWEQNIYSLGELEKTTYVFSGNDL